ncbi:hypothetical protein GQ42DRAFT_162316 [Ramicandelaber brevisporus]|nr:hypothetical protein GQ42DRAFT_162316 [Ramicandelaber brevisporus]
MQPSRPAQLPSFPVSVYNHAPVGLLVRFLQLQLPSSTPPRSSLRVDTLLAGRSLSFTGPHLVASCRSCRLFQGGLVTPNC